MCAVHVMDLLKIMTYVGINSDHIKWW